MSNLVTVLVVLALAVASVLLQRWEYRRQRAWIRRTVETTPAPRASVSVARPVPKGLRTEELG